MFQVVLQFKVSRLLSVFILYTFFDSSLSSKASLGHSTMRRLEYSSYILVVCSLHCWNQIYDTMTLLSRNQKMRYFIKNFFYACTISEQPLQVFASD